jgi:Arc/MetJ family transcription regulator
MMPMRRTLIIDEALIKRARELTGIQEKTAIVKAGLEAPIARAAARRLAGIGGTNPKLPSIPRRRSGGLSG